jgi:hypothetical protein
VLIAKDQCASCPIARQSKDRGNLGPGGQRVHRDPVLLGSALTFLIWALIGTIAALWCALLWLLLLR